jgi:hypothetical protein
MGFGANCASPGSGWLGYSLSPGTETFYLFPRRLVSSPPFRRLRPRWDSRPGAKSNSISETQGPIAICRLGYLWVVASSALCVGFVRRRRMVALPAKLAGAGGFAGPGSVFRCQSTTGRALASAAISWICRIPTAGEAFLAVDLLSHTPPGACAMQGGRSARLSSDYRVCMIAVCSSILRWLAQSF